MFRRARAGSPPIRPRGSSALKCSAFRKASVLNGWRGEVRRCCRALTLRRLCGCFEKTGARAE
eukprot:6174458-Pleurochrysis_carterae.AAC.1